MITNVKRGAKIAMKAYFTCFLLLLFAFGPINVTADVNNTNHVKPLDEIWPKIPSNE